MDRAFTLNYGDPSTDLERVLEDDPKEEYGRVAQGLDVSAK